MLMHLELCTYLYIASRFKAKTLQSFAQTRRAETYPCCVAGASDGVNGRSPEVSVAVESRRTEKNSPTTFWLKFWTYKYYNLDRQILFSKLVFCAESGVPGIPGQLLAATCPTNVES